MAVARGNAVVVTNDGRRISADTLVAYTTDAPAPRPRRPGRRQAGRQPARRAIRWSTLRQAAEGGGVRQCRRSARRPTRAIGDRGVYVPDTGMARLVGHVRITRGAEPARWPGGGGEHEDRHRPRLLAGAERAGAGPGGAERRPAGDATGSGQRPRPGPAGHERDCACARTARPPPASASLPAARAWSRAASARPTRSARWCGTCRFALRRGEAVGLLGPNGAGKTTTFYMIVGLVQPDTGSISLDGADITALPMYRRARLGIGYLPQEASVFRGLNVEQNIMAALEVVEPDPRPARADAGRTAGRVRHRPSAPHAGAGAVRRRAAARGDRPRAGHAAGLHPARRAAGRHRPDRGERNPRPGRRISRIAASAC